jgi:hypothetical protein
MMVVVDGDVVVMVIDAAVVFMKKWLHFYHMCGKFITVADAKVDVVVDVI